MFAAWPKMESSSVCFLLHSYIEISISCNSYWAAWYLEHWCCCCSVPKSSLTLCNPLDCSTPGSSVLNYLIKFAQTQVYSDSDAIKLSHPLLPPSPFALNLSQHQGLFQWVSSLHQVDKVLQLQHQSFQWISIFLMNIYAINICAHRHTYLYMYI